MKKLSILLLMVALLGCGVLYTFRQIRLHSVPATAWRYLRESPQLTLYSIHPEEGPQSAPADAPHFHGYRILGQVSVSAAADRQRIIHEIEHAVFTGFDQFACFNPHHAIHAADGRNTYDFLICYECGAMQIYAGDKFIGETEIGGTPDTLNAFLLTMGIPPSR